MYYLKIIENTIPLYLTFFPQKPSLTGPLELRHWVLFYHLTQTKKENRGADWLENEQNNFLDSLWQAWLSCAVSLPKGASLFYSLNILKWKKLWKYKWCQMTKGVAEPYYKEEQLRITGDG